MQRRTGMLVFRRKSRIRNDCNNSEVPAWIVRRLFEQQAEPFSRLGRSGEHLGMFGAQTRGNDRVLNFIGITRRATRAQVSTAYAASRWRCPASPLPRRAVPAPGLSRCLGAPARDAAGARVACRIMVELLALAHERSCEADLAAALVEQYELTSGDHHHLLDRNGFRGRDGQQGLPARQAGGEC